MSKQEEKPSPLIDFFCTLTDFMKDLFPFLPQSEKHLNELEDVGLWDETKQKDLIKQVVSCLKAHSRSILLQEPQLFDQPLIILDDLNLSDVWNHKDANHQTKQALLLYIEQLYVFGNLYLRPNRAQQFLKLVRSLKETKNNIESLTQIENDKGGDEGGDEGGEVDENVNEAIEKVNEMFGFQSGDFMSDMINDIAMKVNDVMKDNDDPSSLFRSLLSGDSSMFTDVMEKSSEKLQEKINAGEVDENLLQSQAEQMMTRFQGIMPPGVNPGVGIMPGVPTPDMFGAPVAPRQLPNHDTPAPTQSPLSTKKPKKKKKRKKKKPRSSP